MLKERPKSQVTLPRDLIDEVDHLVGRRQRGDFVTEAVREKLERARREIVLCETAGALTGDYPEWETPEKVSQWVRLSRGSDDEGFRQAWCEVDDG